MTAAETGSFVVDKSGERVRRMFGSIARRYDLLNHLLSANVDRYWRWRTVRTVPPQGGDPILDVCTGTGDLALAYDRAAGRLAGTSAAVTASGIPAPSRPRIIGADFCPQMLTIACQKARAAGAKERIDFVEADAQALPFPDHHFQIVSVAFGLRNVTDTDRGLREMTRVCRPGGRVAVLEFSRPSWEPFRSLYGWYFRRVLPKVGQLISRNDYEAYRYLPESVGEFPDGEALAKRMRAAGLCEVVFHPLTGGIATLYVGTK